VAAAAAIAVVSFLMVNLGFGQFEPPPPIRISVCPAVTSGERRIVSNFGVRFDVPEKTFDVYASPRDMPAGTLYVITLRDTKANAVVWLDDGVFRELKIAYPAFSKRVETREIRDAAGRLWGTDRWGVLPSGERWRFVTFSTGDAVGYDPVPPNEAALLDRLVDSACVLR
jgi:hypothetical protein